MGGIGLQLGTGYTLAFLVYQTGTLITTGSLGAGFAPGLAAVLVMACTVIYLMFNSSRKLKDEYSLRSVKA